MYFSDISKWPFMAQKPLILVTNDDGIKLDINHPDFHNFQTIVKMSKSKKKICNTFYSLQLNIPIQT